MKNKKKISLIMGGILLIIIAFLAIFFLFNHSSPKKKLTKTDKIIEKIDQKQDFLLLITSSDQKACYLCEDVKTIINFYKSYYKLKFTTFDIEENGNKNLRKIKNKLNIDDKSLKEPAVIMIKNGKLKGIANEILGEQALKELLIKYDFLKEDAAAEKQITNEEFLEKLASPEKSLIVILDYGESSSKFRKQLANYSKKYNFKYDMIYYGVSEGVVISSKIKDNLKEKNPNFKMVVPMVAIIQNNDVTDYISTIDEKKLASFLNKNGYFVQ